MIAPIEDDDFSLVAEVMKRNVDTHGSYTVTFSKEKIDALGLAINDICTLIRGFAEIIMGREVTVIDASLPNESWQFTIHDKREQA